MRNSLAKGNIIKWDAFQRAQIAVLQNEEFAHPYYWSASVMLGNWL
jgi:CHAT domain-containing protein